MTFQAFRGSSGAQIAFTILLATSIGDRVTQCTAHERGVANAVKVGQKSSFLENKVVVNFEFRHGAKKLGHLDHPLQSYVKINFKYFIIFYKKLVCSGLPPAGSKTKIFSMICIGIFLACIQKIQKTGTPRKKCFFQKM